MELGERESVLPDSAMLVQRVNPLTGEAEWVVLDDKKGSEGMQVLQDASTTGGMGGAAELIGHSLYLDMLNDRERNVKFNAAIRKAVRHGDHVLDIGTGTGLLAMMAARAMADSAADSAVPVGSGQDHAESASPGDGLLSGTGTGGLVTACEAFLPMAQLASEVVQANGLAPPVNVVNRRSTELEVGPGKDMPRRADVLVSEILDSELLGEGLLATLRDAHARLLVPGARMVPRRATVYAQLIESEHLRRCADLSVSEDELADGLRLVPPPPLPDDNVAPYSAHEEAANISSPTQAQAVSNVVAAPLDGRAHHRVNVAAPRERACDGASAPRLDMHVDGLGNQVCQLSEPFSALSFDFVDPPHDRGAVTQDIIASASGTVDAIVFWWRLELDDDGSIVYSTAPDWTRSAGGEECSGSSAGGPHAWRDHWKQSVRLMPGGGLPVARGQRLRATSAHDDVSIWCDLAQADESTPVEPHSPDSTHGTRETSDEHEREEEEKRTFEGVGQSKGSGEALICGDPRAERGALRDGGQSIEGEGSEISLTGRTGMQRFLRGLFPPYRIGLMGDPEWREKYVETMREVVARAKGRGQSAVQVLSLDDGVLLPLALASADCHVKVTALLPGLRADGARLLGDTGSANRVDPRQLAVLEKRAAQLGRADTWRLKGLDAVVGEPYYMATKGDPPWGPALRFWHDLSLVRGLLKDGGSISPHRGVVRGVLASLPDLWASRRGLASLEGFDHSTANALLGACGAAGKSGSDTCPVLVYPTWQCGRFKELSGRFDVIELDFTAPLESKVVQVKVPVVQAREDRVCDAIVLWVDWVLDAQGQRAVSTAPRADGSPGFTKQGIKLLQHPIKLCGIAPVGKHKRHEKSGTDNSPRMSVPDSSVVMDVNLSIDSGTLSVKVQGLRFQTPS